MEIYRNWHGTELSLAKAGRGWRPGNEAFASDKSWAWRPGNEASLDYTERVLLAYISNSSNCLITYIHRRNSIWKICS